ncbi:interleukin-17A-like [Pelodytes ibericus]
MWGSGHIELRALTWSPSIQTKEQKTRSCYGQPMETIHGEHSTTLSWVLISDDGVTYRLPLESLNESCKVHLTLWAFTLLGSVNGLDLHHLNKRCHLNRDTKFPLLISVTLNVTGQPQPAGPDVRKRSLSPWDYSYDVDHNRFPTVIAMAKCRHDSCVDSNGKEGNFGNSVPIRQEILVLHREVKDCKPVFKLEKKMITVGCTCVRHIILQQI